jgi:DNA-binding transcriptional ArsR family regulator
MLRYLGQVLDREDRLESGTGSWKQGLTAAATQSAVRETVLRSLRLATEPANFMILEALSSEAAVPAGRLAEATGLERLTIEERVSDLVSAGMVTKVPEANQVAGTAAGAVLVRLVKEAVAAGVLELRDL